MWRWLAAVCGVLAAAVLLGGVVALVDPLAVVDPMAGIPSLPRNSGPVVTTATAHRDTVAAASCRGLPWTVLAAFGVAEPAVQGEAALAGTLCADGGGGGPGALAGAVRDVAGSAAAAAVVLVVAGGLAADPGLGRVPAVALSFAARQIGVPYRWGGTGPDGFDCSGLVQAAYQAARVALPRVAQAQFEAGPDVVAGATLEPGDLVFFGTSPGQIGHVGLYVANGVMIDAPYPGSSVRLDPVGRPVGASRPG